MQASCALTQILSQLLCAISCGVTWAKHVAEPEVNVTLPVSPHDEREDRRDGGAGVRAGAAAV